MTKERSIKRLLVLGLAVGLAGIMGASSFASSTAGTATTDKASHTRSASAMKRGAFDSTRILSDLKTKLSSLVGEGKLTQEKADKVYSYFEKNKPGSGDRSARAGKNPLDQLVADKIITSDEADMLKGAIHMGHGKGHGGQERMNGLLGDMVKDGVIDQATSDKITSYMKNRASKAPAASETTSTSTSN